jgi:phosphatidylglycerol---prolipoprotein diacylglyceryl transferase
MADRLLFGVVPVYGLLIACAIAAGVFLCAREERRLGLPRDTALDLVLYIVPPAILGARLYYAAFRMDLFYADPVRILYVWEGGLAIYGGVIGGAVGALVFSRRRKLKYALLADMVAPALILGQAIGRWGNYFNGEAFGFSVSNHAWQFFPASVLTDGGWHLATFFYESVWDLAGFFILHLSRKKTRRSGDLFIGYLLWYGAGRMVIEGLRTDSLMLAGLRVSQIISIGMCLFALTALYRRAPAGRASKLLLLLGGLMMLAWAAASAMGLQAWLCVLLIGLCSALLLAAGGTLYARLREADGPVRQETGLI